jgi:hypothetical protein
MVDYQNSSTKLSLICLVCFRFMFQNAKMLRKYGFTKHFYKKIED